MSSKKRIIVAAFALGAIEREVGILEELRRVGAVVRRNGDADGNADDDLVALDLVGLADQADQALGKIDGLLPMVGVDLLQDGEFVAAEPADRVALAHRPLQAPRDGLQQRVADRMAERVVDRLELVEVEHEDREAFALARQPCQRLVHLLAEQRAIGEIGQRIMSCHMRDARFRALTLGDVLMRRDPAAAGRRLVLQRDHAAVVEMRDHVDIFAMRELPPQAREIGVDIGREIAGLLAQPQDFRERAAGLHDIGRQIVHLQVTLVADHEPFLRVEHAQALRHVVERGVDAGIGLLEARLALLDRSFGRNEAAELGARAP